MQEQIKIKIQDAKQMKEEEQFSKDNEEDKPQQEHAEGIIKNLDSIKPIELSNILPLKSPKMLTVNESGTLSLNPKYLQYKEINT